MTTAIKDLIDTIKAKIDTDIGTAYSINIYHDNERGEPDPDSLGATGVWIRAFVLVGGRPRRSVPTKIYKQTGVIYFHIYGKVNLGTDAVLTVADYIDTIFRDTKAGGISYRQPTVGGSGARERQWWQLLVTVPFFSIFSDT